jgi:antitoxin component YwqK of YwqJK toxin-antitoxin module
MFKYLLIVSILFIISCKPHTEKIVRETYPDGKQKLVEFIDTKKGNKDSYKMSYYYPDNKIKSEGEFKNGKMNGKWTYYYENGKKWSEGYFKEGIEEGLRTAYYENGKKRYAGLFRDGKRTGEWKFWDESGKLVQKITN